MRSLTVGLFIGLVIALQISAQTGPGAAAAGKARDAVILSDKKLIDKDKGEVTFISEPFGNWRRDLGFSIAPQQLDRLEGAARRAAKERGFNEKSAKQALILSLFDAKDRGYSTKW